VVWRLFFINKHAGSVFASGVFSAVACGGQKQLGMKRSATSLSSSEPYVAPEVSLPEITLKALILGVVLAAVLAAANAYLGLKVGMTVSASIPAAVISMGVLRLFRRVNILENNIVQTAASAGESIAAGVIFTLPALILLGYWQGFPYLDTLAIAATGGILGVLFTIPLRRALIVEGGLRFPEGIATAEVLIAGDAGARGVRDIVVAAVVGGLVKLLQTGFRVLAGSASGAVQVGRALFGFGSELGVALLAVGYIVGLRIATLVLVGGLISWFLGIPIYTVLHGLPQGIRGYEAALQIWSTKIRYLGVGAMAVGGIWALLALLRPLRDGVRASWQAFRTIRQGRQAAIPRTERDTPIPFVLMGMLLLIFPLSVVFLHVIDASSLGIAGGAYAVTLGFAVLFALVAGFLFSSVAGYMAGLVGSSNNPISGVTIATILAAALLLLLLWGQGLGIRIEASRAVVAAATTILIGAVVCCAAAIAGDNMQDLKTGYLVGATPYKQQIMQIVGTLTGALVVAPVLELLFRAYGLGGVFPRPGMDPSQMLAAPQASLMQSVARGVFDHSLDWTIVGLGAALAVGIIAADQVLKARGSPFRMPVLAVAVGIYLPLELSVPIFVGGLVAYAAHKARGYAESSRGVLFASGLITGEALMGVLLAVPFALAQSTEVLRLVPESFGPVSQALGVLVFLSVALWLYRVARL